MELTHECHTFHTQLLDLNNDQINAKAENDRVKKQMETIISDLKSERISDLKKIDELRQLYQDSKRCVQIAREKYAKQSRKEQKTYDKYQNLKDSLTISKQHLNILLKMKDKIGEDRFDEFMHDLRTFKSLKKKKAKKVASSVSDTIYFCGVWRAQKKSNDDGGRWKMND